jgi:hypothetical protein
MISKKLQFMLDEVLEDFVGDCPEAAIMKAGGMLPSV